MKFQQIVEASPTAIFVTQDARIRYVNPTLAAMTGYTAEELIGTDPIDLADPADPERERELGKARLRGEIPGARFETRIRTRSGQERWVDFTITPIMYQGGAGVVGTGIDITERKRLEERMQQGQRLEAVGRLAGGIAHDFNNLLLIITGQTESLLNGLAAVDPLHRGAQAIASAAARAATLTEQLLAFGRRQTLIATPLNLGDIVADLEPLVRSIVGENIRVERRATADLPLVRVDRARIEQVVTNLVANARDAMPDGGTLTMTTDVVEADDAMRRGRSWLPAGTFVRLQVADTGMGIIPEIMSRVFEPFFTTRRSNQGIGLGLSTVVGIVKQSAGYVWIDSQPGAGACVTILLPPALRDATVVVAPDRRPAAAIPRVLLVDDEEPIRELLGIVLENNGFELLSVGSAEEALQVVSDHAFDILLTDVVLPGISGPELARRVRGVLPGIRVLFMSGYTGEKALEGTNLGDVEGFIKKPFATAALVARLRSLVAGD